MQQSVEIFGHLPDGRAVERVTLRAGALSVKLLCWGAILQDLRFGELDYSLTQGSASLGPYLDTMRYHGPIIGPVVNRITGAKAQIGDQTHLFEANQTPDIC
ncbi:MAG: galactose mutarotase, partial [Paracoccaceae bacterium]|nr:galactose mutarotase [Paracoccaceae bacterium]